MISTPIGKPKAITGLKLLVLLLFLALLQDGFGLQLKTLLQSENPLRNVAVFLVIWGLSVACVLLLSLVPNIALRVLWGSLYAASIWVYLTFKSIMGYPPTLGDAKILWVETGQATAAILFYWSNMLLPALFAAAFFAAFVWPTRRIELLARRRLLLPLGLAPLLPLLMISGMLVIKGGGAGVGIPAGVYAPGSYVTSILYETSTQPNIERRAVSYDRPERRPIKNIIVVVDESVSGDFIALDPSATLTPFLASERAAIADFGQATSGHNCSSFSNAILRWGIGPSSLTSAETLPTIWQYARRAGFTTTYIDAQKQPGTYGNFMSIRETADIDNMVQYKSPQIERDADYISNDFRAARTALELIRSSDDNFIYINKLGVHFPYEGKYPESEVKYRPHMSLAQPMSNATREQLLNSYRNAIHWNVDNFFRALLDREALQNTLIIYTSDHGQNLLDDGTATHCNRSSDSPYQALVPLLVLTQDPKLLEDFKSAAAINRGQASHFNIFPTVLELMGYPSQQVARDYPTGLLSPITRLGKFSCGDLLDPDVYRREFHWKTVPQQLESRR